MFRRHRHDLPAARNRNVSPVPSRNFVWRIAVYLICTEKNEDRFGTMLPSRLQKIYGTQRVDFEIQQRNFRALSWEG